MVKSRPYVARTPVRVLVAAVTLCAATTGALSVAPGTPLTSKTTRAPPVPENTGSTTTKENAEILQRIENLAKNTKNGVAASPDVAAEVNALCESLVSPDPKPTTSNRLDGRFQLLFTTTRGTSAGQLGPFVGKVFQDIDLASGAYRNELDLTFLRAELGATWDVLSDTDWRVIFRDLTFYLFGVVPLGKKDLTATGIWRMTYLDDDFRVLYARAEDAADERSENVYVLKRV